MRMSGLFHGLKKSQDLQVYIIMACCFCLGFFVIKEGHNMGDDFALYIEQARAITKGTVGELYERNKFTMDQSNRLLGPYIYPMGFPLLLSMVYLLFGINFVVMKFFCFLFFIASFPILLRIFRGYTSDLYIPVCIIVLLAFDVRYLGFADNIMSDLPYFFLSILSLYLISKSSTILHQFLTCLIIIFTYLTRDVGIVLVPVFMLYQLQHYFFSKNERHKLIFYATPYIIFSILFLYKQIYMSGGQANHVNMFFGERAYKEYLSNILFYIESYHKVILHGMPKFLIFPAIIITLIGVWKSIEKYSYLILYLIFSFAIYLIWPGQQIRFFLTLAPFLYFFLFIGLDYLVRRLNWSRVYFLRIMFVVIAFFTLQYLYKIIFEYGTRDTNEIYTDQMQSIYTYIKKNTDKEAVVAFEEPRALRLFTGRNTIYTDIQQFHSSPADYLLIRKSDYVEDVSRYERIETWDDFTMIRKK